MTTKLNRTVRWVALAATLALSIAPMMAPAQSRADVNHRQKTKNDWRTAAYASGALGLFGLLAHKDTLTFLGAAGALYSLDRYEHDRKSENSMERRRAALYHRASYTHNGHTYVRKTVYKNGHKYFRFVRAT